MTNFFPKITWFIFFQFWSISRSVLVCFSLFWSLSVCFSLFWSVSRSVSRSVSVCFSLFQSFWSVLVRFGLFWSILVCFSPFWFVSVRFGSYQYSQAPCSVDPLCPEFIGLERRLPNTAYYFFQLHSSTLYSFWQREISSEEFMIFYMTSYFP